jgi:hypothetical protein
MARHLRSGRRSWQRGGRAAPALAARPCSSDGAVRRRVPYSLAGRRRGPVAPMERSDGVSPADQRRVSYGSDGTAPSSVSAWPPSPSLASDLVPTLASAPADTRAAEHRGHQARASAIAARRARPKGVHAAEQRARAPPCPWHPRV